MELYLAGLVGGTVAFALGWVYYGPLFGRIYDRGLAKLPHIPKNAFERPDPALLALTYLLSVSAATAVAAVYQASAISAPGLGIGLLLGLLAWVIAVSMYQSQVMYIRIPRAVALLTIGYWLLSFLIFGATAALMLA